MRTTLWLEVSYMIINKQNNTKMKKLTQILLVFVVALNLSSCHTTEKFVVYGTPGTEIYTPTQERLGVIDYDGIARIKISSDGCYTYLLSKDSSSPLYIPFALDYENKSYIGSRVFVVAGGVVFLGSLITGLVAGLTSGDDDAPLASVALLAIPAGIGTSVISNRLNQTTRQWKFTYRETQHTNSDLNFAQPVFSEPPKK